MSPFRQHVRGSRLAAAGIAATTATLMAAVLSPVADAADRPTRAQAIDNAASAVADRAASLGINSAQGTSVRDVVVDKDGTQHVRYDRTYRQLPVLGGDFVVHLAPDGAYRNADRATRNAIALATITPAVPAPEAADKAVNALRAAHLGAGVRQAKAKPQLVVDALHGTPKLAWKTDAVGLDAQGNPVARTVVTDARTGAQIDAWDAIETAAGDGQSLYGGTVPLETTLSGTTYQLKDPSRGNTYTGDAENKTDLCIFGICIVRAPATLFTDADNHWGTGTTASRATAAVDAQYGTDVTWDYYKNVHGRNGIGNDGKGSYNRVHYGNGYNNAFWDDSCFCMTYGDGDGTQLGPLVALDVAGHEMSHGVTSKTANLTYSGESGGLNEATSDIFGTLVEFHAANSNDPGDYLIGEKIVRSGFGRDALRYMDRPSRDANSADYWSSSVGGLDVHYSSGVANHFAYLLAEGSGTKTINGVTYNSPTSNGSTLTGIGRAKLGAIWYRALTVYMTSSTNYAGARTATLNAARDLYGNGSAEYNAVAATWSAVNVN
ncbi:M4 family metallopeptidase [Streptomyces acidiscabies]|uniref:Neutral metalloproteinase n=1 Tax=Streptomyces acidiscabies TaxID=42234 RepID=A0AAP6B6W6_9ACTN|nr:M4 family metallopeptidase [Streptomyces acidiscabies]MBP5939759.1 M4 family metallopeptidase [Streptomyces sp. LBUM 1476]MBZ3910940.1 M4 family metallopeptidase [Streptomyces acidiscabies]MDX2959280.1 M4 family metallopeptidase [Streptomyces acidiscabies]MDX3017576.1 M4 family metallopeptidase [Streptomyces acidiscabies]MDX3788051.1 M4 family metallopeptidase [Streptomyces acidiscabies]